MDWFGAFRVRWTVENTISPLCVHVNQNVYGAWKGIEPPSFPACATHDADPWDGSFSTWDVGQGSLSWRTFGSESLESIQQATQHIFPALIQKLEKSLRGEHGYRYGLHPLVLAINRGLWAYRRQADDKTGPSFVGAYAIADIWRHVTPLFWRGSYGEKRMGSFTAISLMDEGAALLLSQGLRRGVVISLNLTPVFEFTSQTAIALPRVYALFYSDLKPVPERDFSLPIASGTQPKDIVSTLVESLESSSWDTLDAVILTWDEAGDISEFHQFCAAFSITRPVPIIKATPSMVLEGLRLFPTVKGWEDSFVLRSAFLPTAEMQARDLRDALAQAQRSQDAPLQEEIRRKLRTLTLNALSARYWENDESFGELQKNSGTEH